MRKINWFKVLLISAAVLMILGLCPWESLFPIQIRSGILLFITSVGIGFLGLEILLFLALNYLQKQKGKLAGWLGGFLILLIIPAAIMCFFSFILPDIKWQDYAVYRNGDDYLVIQNFEGFVTNSPKDPRLIRTASPYNMIRIVEEQVTISGDDGRFKGNKITFDDKTWYKETAL